MIDGKARFNFFGRQLGVRMDGAFHGNGGIMRKNGWASHAEWVTHRHGEQCRLATKCPDTAGAYCLKRLKI
jgi:hypothetical protein